MRVVHECAVDGAVGAALLGAVFAARAGGAHASGASLHALGSASRTQIIDGVQTVFLLAAPVAALALLIVLRLAELALRTRPSAPERPQATVTSRLRPRPEAHVPAPR